MSFLGFVGAQTSGGLPLAGGNLNFYVATTGSDSNPGTLALPFATIQHAALAAAKFDYGSAFSPTINVEPGTYTVTSTIILPELTNLAPFTNGQIVNTGTHPTISASTIVGPAIRASGWFSNWQIGSIIVDSDSCCFEAIHGASLTFIAGAVVGLNDSTGLGDVTWFQSGSSGLIGASGVTFQVMTASFFAMYENFSNVGSGDYGFISLLSCAFQLQASTTAFAWIYAKFNDFSSTHKFQNMTYTNTATLTCAQAIIAASGGIQYLITDNGLLSDLPGQATNNKVDNTCYISSVNSTPFGIFMNFNSGIPTTSQVATNTWGVYKDTSGGGVYIVANDAGTIKKAQLT